jgi:DNA-binding transcriptional LysR family regulator
MEYKNIPDLKALAALRAVFELGGVIEAGRKLHVGQPAITKRLRSLEECYGVSLVHRKGRKLELTPAGEKVSQFARLILDHQLLLLEDLESLRLGQNRLRLEVNFSIGEHLLTDILLSFAKRYPQFQIDSRIGYTRRIQTQLAMGLADMALMEQAPDHPDILVQKWLEDELILVCSVKHSIAGCDMLSIQELLSLQYVLREPKSSLRIELDKALKVVGINHLPIFMEIGSTDTIIEMLERGEYVSFLPRYAVSEALEKKQLYHIKTQGLRIKRTLWIARTRSNINNPVAEAFIEVLRQQTY